MITFVKDMRHRNEYIGLWCLLLVAFAVVAGASAFDPVMVGDFELKTSGIASRLTRETSTVSPDTVKSIPAIAEKQETDSSAQNILIIGDSMLEGLNPRLAAYAEANGHTLNSVIWYSSTTAYWGCCDTLQVFMRKFKPTFVFISLGANELFVNDIAAKREDMLKYFLSQLGDTPYLWIGPPNWKPDTGINDMIARNVPAGCYFKSDGMHFDRAKDGAHPTHASAALWMDSIARWMPLHGAHPILLDNPGALKARPASVTVLQPLKSPLPPRHRKK